MVDEKIVAKLREQRGKRYISDEDGELADWCMRSVFKGDWSGMFVKSDRSFKRMVELAKEIGFWPWLHAPLYPDHDYVPLMTLSDAFFLCRFIEMRGIRRVLELGCAGTGTSHLISWLFDIPVVAVDIEAKYEEDHRYLETVKPSKVEFIVADVRKAYRTLIGEHKPDLVVIDFEHRYESSKEIAEHCLNNGIPFAVHDVNCEVEEALVAVHFLQICKSYFKSPSACGWFFCIPCKIKSS